MVVRAEVQVFVLMLLERVQRVDGLHAVLVQAVVVVDGLPLVGAAHGLQLVVGQQYSGVVRHQDGVDLRCTVQRVVRRVDGVGIRGGCVLREAVTGIGGAVLDVQSLRHLAFHGVFQIGCVVVLRKLRGCLLRARRAVGAAGIRDGIRMRHAAVHLRVRVDAVQRVECLVQRDKLVAERVGVGIPGGYALSPVAVQERIPGELRELRQHAVLGS